MATHRSRRPRDDDDEDDEDDDRPRSRRRHDDEEDEDDRPRRRYGAERSGLRRPRRRSRGPGPGLILGIGGGVFAIVGVIVFVVLLSGGGLGGADISYARWKEIRAGDTLETLEKRFGRATKVDRSEWADIEFGEAGDRLTSLEDVDPTGRVAEAWYRWRKGKEEVYVAHGKDHEGKSGLTLKLYLNPDALKVNKGRYDPKRPGDVSKLVPFYELGPIR